MKKFLLLLLIICLLPTGFPVRAEDEEYLRGVWVSSVLNLDYPSAPGLSDEALRQEADRVIALCASTGMNAIFFQVRPCADALYCSSIFPPSAYLMGERTGPVSFDPLAYMTKKAHERGIQLHAWINPYRVTCSHGDEELKRFPANSPQRLHPEYLMKASDGNYFFNPAMQEVRDLITAGVVEILDNYEVDGIHFDDYFYPDADYDDSAQFYASGWGNLAQWRINNVNLLVEQVSQTVRSRGRVFGISPRGIWANASDNPRGSATRGGGSLDSIYCDSLRFIEEGWVDYICPQIYWNIGYSIADYAILVPWWVKAVEGTNVKLYIGMADYRSAENYSPVWAGSDELDRQSKLNQSYKAVSGEIHFRYGSIVGSTELYKYYRDKAEQTAPETSAARLKRLIKEIIQNMFS